MIIAFARFIKKSINRCDTSVARNHRKRRYCSERIPREKRLLRDGRERRERGEKVHESDKLVANAGTSRGVPLSPDESKTWFGRRGRANVIAAMSSRTCFRMSLTDLADSISFVVSCMAGIFGNYKLSYIEESLVLIKFYEEERAASLSLSLFVYSKRRNSIRNLRSCIAVSRNAQIYDGANYAIVSYMRAFVTDERCVLVWFVNFCSIAERNGCKFAELSIWNKSNNL